jgi:carbon storage regulator
MLILSRKRSEEIVINDNITIVVAEIHRGMVRLGIVAPKEIPIHRKEVQDKIHRDEPGTGNPYLQFPRKTTDRRNAG